MRGQANLRIGIIVDEKRPEANDDLAHVVGTDIREEVAEELVFRGRPDH